jgi:hypothetical protein
MPFDFAKGIIQPEKNVAAARYMREVFPECENKTFTFFVAVAHCLKECQLVLQFFCCWSGPLFGVHSGFTDSKLLVPASCSEKIEL